MDEYELTVLYDINSKPGDIYEVEQYITKHFIIKTRREEGVKQLAYEINGANFVEYVFYELITRDEKNSEKDLSQQLNIMDNVIRYLLLRIDKRKRR